MNFLVISFSVITLFLAGCNKVEKVDKESSMHIFGSMATQNKTDLKLNRVSVIMDGQAIDFGVLIPGTTATMGFGDFELGKELKVVWIENFSSDNPTKGEAFFDSSKLSEIAKDIQEIEFVYIGEKKWTLRAYKAPHRNDKDLIKEIDSVGNEIIK